MAVFVLFLTPNTRDVAQVVARSVRDAEVAGSSPVIPTNEKPTFGLVFYWLWYVGVKQLVPTGPSIHFIKIHARQP